MSEMDDLFERIFDERPRKAGTGFEMLVCAALKHVHSRAVILHDQYIRGDHSKTVYQLDALIKGIESKFVEAKDYTENGKKVGRGDITKLAGALQELPVDKGVLASATGFTAPAKKYSDASDKMLSGKKIDLIHLRPSTTKDELGRIKTICINLYIYLADYGNAQWKPVFTPEGMSLLNSRFSEGQKIDAKTYAFYRQDGSVLETIFDLTSRLGVTDWDKRIGEGEWRWSEPAFIEISGMLVPISSVRYIVPYNVADEQIIIEAEGTPCLVLKSEDGQIDKLFTDLNLKKTRFLEDGTIEIDG